MKKDEPAYDPLVLHASLVGDQVDMVLTREGYATLIAARERLREEDPSADFQDVLLEAIELLLEDLKQQN